MFVGSFGSQLSLPHGPATERRWTHATRCVTSTVLYTTVDARCDELATVVGRTKLTTLATIDVPWRNFSKSRVWDKEESTRILGDIRIPLGCWMYRKITLLLLFDYSCKFNSAFLYYLFQTVSTLCGRSSQQLLSSVQPTYRRV